MSVSPHCVQNANEVVIGTVPYLNVQPMIWAIQRGILKDNVRLAADVPRLLANQLYEGRYHCAIVPVFEYFRRPGHYKYVPGSAIAARGKVDSVLLCAAESMERLHTVYLDTSSLTSVHLFQILAAESGLKLKFLDTATHPVPRPLPPGTGWVVIGDPAIAEHGKHPFTLDLASAWMDLTGLPFVFAAWLVPQSTRGFDLEGILTRSLNEGLANLPQVARKSAPAFNVTPEFALDYFQNSIHYSLGEKELAGWTEFGRLCYKHGLTSRETPLIPYDGK